MITITSQVVIAVGCDPDSTWGLSACIFAGTSGIKCGAKWLIAGNAYKKPYKFRLHDMKITKKSRYEIFN